MRTRVWCFRESPLADPPQLTPRTLAMVRDAQSWSALVPFAEADGAESARSKASRAT